MQRSLTEMGFDNNRGLCAEGPWAAIPHFWEDLHRRGVNFPVLLTLLDYIPSVFGYIQCRSLLSKACSLATYLMSCRFVQNQIQSSFICHFWLVHPCVFTNKHLNWLHLNGDFTNRNGFRLQECISILVFLGLWDISGYFIWYFWLTIRWLGRSSPNCLPAGNMDDP